MTIKTKKLIIFCQLLGFDIQSRDTISASIISELQVPYYIFLGFDTMRLSTCHQEDRNCCRKTTQEVLLLLDWSVSISLLLVSWLVVNIVALMAINVLVSWKHTKPKLNQNHVTTKCRFNVHIFTSTNCITSTISLSTICTLIILYWSRLCHKIG